VVGLRRDPTVLQLLLECSRPPAGLHDQLVVLGLVWGNTHLAALLNQCGVGPVLQSHEGNSLVFKAMQFLQVSHATP
jgi:hypothetical protein